MLDKPKKRVSWGLCGVDRSRQVLDGKKNMHAVSLVLCSCVQMAGPGAVTRAVPGSGSSDGKSRHPGGRRLGRQGCRTVRRDPEKERAKKGAHILYKSPAGDSCWSPKYMCEEHTGAGLRTAIWSP